MVVEKLSLIEDILFFEIFVKGWVGVFTGQTVTDEHAGQFRLMKKKRAFVERKFSWNKASFSIILFEMYLTDDRIDVIANWKF